MVRGYEDRNGNQVIFEGENPSYSARGGGEKKKIPGLVPVT